MTHWIVHPLRGWLGFLAITNLGTGLRCLWENGFLQKRIFTQADGGCEEMERMFGFWSLFNALLFLHCSIFLQEMAVFSMTVCSLVLYLCYFLNESYIHHSITKGAAGLFPILLSGLTIIWLIVSFRFIWLPDTIAEEDENECLAKRFPMQHTRRKKTQ
ncbi:uncharacterized protein LOC135398153 [Ornithodoros turicata]|uniref:uncharacterized protein LOC135398153 n=1 Tax=Ornithodoros turicata TaxID=34597 RepID=UPI00313A311C